MMPHHKKKRSRSRSEDERRHRRKRDGVNVLQEQLDTLTKVMENLVSVQKELKPIEHCSETSIIDKDVIGE